MHRIHIPSDDLARHDYWLHHPGSVADLEAMGPALEPGAAVTLVTPNGGEQLATLHFPTEVNCWIAYPSR